MMELRVKPGNIQGYALYFCAVHTIRDGSIKDVKCPVAFTTGEKDIVVPGYMVLDNYNALKDNAILLFYENCGHSPMVDCPDRLAKDVIEFFGK